MTDFSPQAESEFNRTRFIALLLDVGGWFVVLATLTWGVLQVFANPPGEGAPAPDFASIVALLVGGLAAALLLWGLGEAIRRLDALRRSDAVESPFAAAALPPGIAVQVPTVESSERMDELVVLLREVRDISLLSEDQRRMRLEAQGRAVLSATMADVPLLLREHNWIEARRRVQSARERFPMFREWDALEQQIEQMRTQVEEHDIASAERQIQDLRMLGAYDRIAEVVKELLERHPDSLRARELAQRDSEERSKAHAATRARLLAQVQDCANHRQWEDAMTLANQLIREYPKSVEAQQLRLDLPRLRENGEILARKRLETEYSTLVREHQYDLALQIARRVIEHYPSSPQAAAMREQLPRLEQRVALATTRD